jgi:CheY-like chemotaxis protein
MPCRILVVDDDAVVRNLLRDMLTQPGYSMVEADDGATALVQLEAGDPLPDLILLDVTMPLLGGFDLLAIIREHPNWRRIPIVVMSGGSDAMELAAEFKVDYLRKPFTGAEILTAVERYCGEPACQGRA